MLMGSVVWMVDGKMLMEIGKDPDNKEEIDFMRVGEKAQTLCMKRTGCEAMTQGA